MSANKMPAIQVRIENFINGNLTDAKKQAKDFSMRPLEECANLYYFGATKKAKLVARYLKGEASFQEV